MKDSAGRIIYVGKAKVLKKRVSSYFQSRQHPPKVSLMMTKVESIDYVVVGSELEALMLESNLIKKHRPRYNVMLRDDKHYPYLKLTVNEDWPRLIVVRKVIPDGAKYYGPYTGGTVRQTIRMVKRLLKIRWCKETPLKDRQIPCIEYHIKRCDAPCIANIAKAEYGQHVKKIELFLEGKYEETIDALQKDMAKASEQEEFERAAVLRDRIYHLKQLAAEQKVLSTELVNRDVVAYVAGSEMACVVIFHIRDGRLVNQENFYPKLALEDTPGSVLASVLGQYYSDVVQPPPEILLNQNISESKLIADLIERLRKRTVKITCPTRGEKKSLVAMTEENAWHLLSRKVADQGVRESGEALLDLRNQLDLPKLPERIEGFDISNIQGSEIVGSMVVFADGEPHKSHYRKFKVSFEGKPDDYASMYEVVLRRYTRSLAGKLPLPDLILIDGGKGQLSAAHKALEKAKLSDVSIVGLAKRLEEIYQPGKSEPIRLSQRSPALKLLQRVRDEAHRFAVRYHRVRREKRMVRG